MTFDAAPALLVTAALVFFIAGLVKGIVGLGLPTVAMALLALFTSPAQAAAWLIVPSLLTNLWQARRGPGAPPRGDPAEAPSLFRRLTPMAAGLCAGTLGGAWWFGAPSGTGATIALGVALVAYGLWALAGVQLTLSPAQERWLGPAAGLLTGLMTAASGVFVMPAVPYLQALGLTRDELIRAMGLSFSVSTIVLAAGLLLNASAPTAAWLVSAALLLPALAGMQCGQSVRRRLSPTAFRYGFFGSLILLGIHLVARGWLAG